MRSTIPGDMSQLIPPGAWPGLPVAVEHAGVNGGNAVARVGDVIHFVAATLAHSNVAPRA
jgi:hypothetical protein